MLVREEYLNKLIEYKEINLIKVITGVRRCGKSTLLLQFRDYLKSINVSDEDIIYINFESSLYYDIKDYKDLFNYVKEKVGNRKAYVLLDEVQSVLMWEKAVNSMLVDLDVQIYITGSNAYLLSSELTTLLAGRVLTLNIYPFSFKEFIKVYPFSEEESLDDKFNKYLQYGGMPNIVNMNNNEDLITSYLNDIKDVVLKKDVIARNNIKNIVVLDNLMTYMASVIGVFTNPLNIAKYLENTRNETVDSYLKMLEDAYIIYKCLRYEVNGKQLLKTQGKYYMIDMGIRNVLSGYNNFDSGSVIENVVYLELKRKGYQVYVGIYKNLEVDFVAIKNGEIKYFQVARNLSDDAVIERETRSLLAINDSYDKYIITLDKVKNKNIKGIKIVNIIDFLLY